MTMTKDQAQMLTALAVACRPNGARRWDSAGVMAALKQVADRSLPEVVMAVIAAASDRDVDSPGVIPTAGSHWQAANKVRVTKLDTAPPGTRCTVCGRVQAEHHLLGKHLGHEYSAPRPVDHKAVVSHVAALKAELAPTSGPTERRGPEDFEAARPELHANLERLRENVPGVRAPAMRMDENEEA